MEFMEYKTETILVKTPKMKLLENPTIQWFLYGDPHYMDKLMHSLWGELQREIEEEAKNVFLFGFSHPHIYKS